MADMESCRHLLLRAESCSILMRTHVPNGLADIKMRMDEAMRGLAD